MYIFELLDPRRTLAAEAANERVFDLGPVYGVEVTVPALASRCVANIDPQHTDRLIGRAAIDVAVSCDLPGQGTVLATVRPDLDAFGYMAVLAMRADGWDIAGPVLARVKEIAEADTMASEWRPGDDPAAVSGRQALFVVVFDHKRTVTDRVRTVREWLETGTFAGFQEAVAQVRKDRAEQVVVDSEIRSAAGGRIAVIESTSRFAVGAAYRHANVVVAVHPAFTFQGGPAHRKITICQARPGLVDLDGVRDALAAIEPGWGGSPTIIGSPQGEPTRIDLDKVIEIVTRHLT